MYQALLNEREQSTYPYTDDGEEEVKETKEKPKTNHGKGTKPPIIKPPPDPK